MSAAPPLARRPCVPGAPRARMVPGAPRARMVPGASRARMVPGALLAGLLGTSPLVGCGDPARAAADGYVAAMQPVLIDNMKLTREFVDVAAEVKKGQVDAASVAARFEQRLVPGAAILRDQVQAVEPEDEALAALHLGLEQAWTGRAEAWGELHRAWRAGELEALDAAMRRNLELKAQEERYFTQVNAWLAPHGQALDAYP